MTPPNPTQSDLVERLRALDAAATPGPWETDSEYDGDGYASSGGGCVSGWNNWFVGADIDGKWRTLLDTVNSDHKLIEDDRDSEGGSAWDVIGAANAELVTFLRNAVPEIIAMAEEAARLRAHCEAMEETIRRAEVRVTAARSFLVIDAKADAQRHLSDVVGLLGAYRGEKGE